MTTPTEVPVLPDLPTVHRPKADDPTRVCALLIHQSFCGPTEAGGTRHYEFGRRFVDRHHDFIVVASDLSYLTGRSVGEQATLPGDLDGIRVIRASTYKPQLPGFLKRVLSMLSFAVTSMSAALRCKGPDVIIGTTPPIFQAASACLVALLRRKPLLLEIRDLWPDFAIDMGVLKNPVLIKLSRWLERTLYRRAAHIVVNSPAYREHLIAQGMAPEKVSLVANGVDVAMFDPQARGESVRKRFGLEDKFVVTYAGALGPANDIGTVIRAAARLQPGHPGIHFLLVGDGKERARLEQSARELKLNNLTFAGPQPKNTMYEFLAASDACLAILQDIPMFRTTYPNKVFDYMAAGRPTILAIDGVIRDVVESAQGGIFVQPGNDMALAQAVLTLSADRALCSQMGMRARTYVAAHFNRNDQAEAFLQLVIRTSNQHR